MCFILHDPLPNYASRLRDRVRKGLYDFYYTLVTLTTCVYIEQVFNILLDTLVNERLVSLYYVHLLHVH